MKKISAFIFLSLTTPAIVFAQVEITDIQPGIGNQFTIIQTESELDPGPAGPDVSWDFTGLGNTYTADYTMYPAEDTPGFDLFPGSSLGWVGNIEGIGDINGFYSFDDGDLYAHGTYSEASGQVISIINDNPHLLYHSPMNYLDTDSSEYSGVTSLGEFFQLNFNGTYKYVVDAYGDVTTPFGSFENSLRVKVTNVENADSQIEPTEVSAEYYWFVPEYPVAVMVISINETFTKGQSDGIEYSNTYLSEYSFITEVIELDSPKFSFYPNPAKTDITFTADFEKQATLTIYSADGRRIENRSFFKNEKIDISSLVPGFYIAEVIYDGNVYARKQFIKAN
jgi:hypothetical protein